MKPHPPLPLLPRSGSSTHTSAQSNTFKFVGPYPWAQYNEDGTLTSEWEKARNTDPEKETGNSSHQPLKQDPKTGTSASASVDTQGPNISASTNNDPPHRLSFQRTKEAIDILRDDIWEVLFNGYVETSRAFYGEEDENVEKERYVCKKILFEQIKFVLDHLEEKCNRLDKGIKDMSKAMEEREKDKAVKTGKD